MSLPDDSKTALAEQLVAYLGNHVDPALQRNHLEVAKRREDEILSGRVRSLDGETVMDRARALIER